MKIKRINTETKENAYFNTITDAARSVNAKIEDWKVELAIVYSMINGTKAYKHKWEKVK